MVVFEKVCTEGNDKSVTEIKDVPPEFMVIFQIFDLPQTKSTVKYGTSPRKMGMTPPKKGNLSNQEKLGASKMHDFSWHLQTINMTTWNEGFN